MPKKYLLLLILLLVAIAALVGIYYGVLYVKKVTNIPIADVNLTSKKTETPPTKEQQLAQIKKNYPEIVTGIINFLDTKTSIKTTIKTDDGKEYILWPAQPKSIYMAFGVENGGRVEIQAKIPENGRLEWGLIKPI